MILSMILSTVVGLDYFAQEIPNKIITEHIKMYYGKEVQ